jgi:hypothetical protein
MTTFIEAPGHFTETYSLDTLLLTHISSRRVRESSTSSNPQSVSAKSEEYAAPRISARPSGTSFRICGSSSTDWNAQLRCKFITNSLAGLVDSGGN